MAVVKKIGRYSEDAILQAFARAGLKDEDINKQLEPALSFLELEEKTKSSLKRKVPTAADVFKSNVLPGICKDLDIYEESILAKPAVEVNIDVDFDTDFTNMPLAEMKKMHLVIIDREQKIGTMDKYIKFVRGKLYEEAYRYVLQKKDVNEYEWFPQELGVSYRTAVRYMSFALLVKKWPRLLVINISFWQLLKHITRLQKHLKDDRDLSARLQCGVELLVQGKRIYVRQKEVMIPSISHNTDPDAAYFEEEESKPKEAEVSDVRDCLENNFEDDEGEDIDAQCDAIIKLELINQ